MTSFNEVISMEFDTACKDVQEIVKPKYKLFTAGLITYPSQRSQNNKSSNIQPQIKNTGKTTLIRLKGSKIP